jgi:glycogen(starch) synthase
MSKSIAILSFSRIARDQRVLRQCDLVAEMGLSLKVIGYAVPGEHIKHDFAAWHLPRPTLVHRLGTVARQLPAYAGPRSATAGFWASPRHRWGYQQIKEAQPRLVIANDWPALVVAARWKAECGGLVHYDSHEFSTLEFNERAWWRVVYKPFVTHLETAAIRAADTISTVGPSLAEELQSYYKLPTRPAVIRNIPNSVQLPDTLELQWPLRLLYHGQVLPDRGLEVLIDSIPQWQTAHRLTIRGDGEPAYIAALRKRSAANSGESKVVFEPAVPPSKVMSVAAQSADVGVHFTPLETKQRHFSLPNKLFEYIGAGLAVAVSPGLDLKTIVSEHGVGVVSENASPEGVAAALNGLTYETVTSFRLKAREASRVLCWENERESLRACLETLMSREVELPQISGHC